MDISPHHQQTITRLAWITAWTALVLGQLHALARARTVSGREDLELPMFRAWAEPALDLFAPILEWGHADTVYVTYGKIWFPCLLATLACALVVRRRRTPTGLEKWSWRVTLTGYAFGCLGTLGYWIVWVGPLEGAKATVFDTWFLATIVPGMLLSMLGSSLLGIALLRHGVRPRVAAVLLTLAFPGLFVITSVTSMGNVLLPVMFGMALLGRAVTREPSGRQLTTSTI